MSGTGQGQKPILEVKARDAEIHALRSAGWQISEIALRFGLTKEGVRYIIKGKPGSNANKLSLEQAYAMLEALDGVALIEAGMPVRRLASIYNRPHGLVPHGGDLATKCW